MALPKLYDLITWHNNTTPALNEDNLNAMSQAIDDIDDRVIGLAGTILEDVPQIQQDMEILEPAVASIASNVQRAETAADDAEADALVSEGYAVGEQDGVEVTSGEYYQNNAKYYAEIANPPIENTVDFTDIITISDAINKAAKDVRLKVEAVQDLHGYDKPWVGGAGKNKCPLTIDEIKAVNTGGTWNGNVYTYETVVFTLQTDSDGNIIGIKATGANNTNDTLSLVIPKTAPLTGSYFISGCPSNGSSSSYNIRIGKGDSSSYAGNDTGNGVAITATGETWDLRLHISRQYTIPTSGLFFYPQIESGSTKTDFEPYTNICPISGWNNVKVTREGKNLLENTAITETKSGITFNVDGSGVVSLSGVLTAQYTTQTIHTDWVAPKSGDYTFGGCPSGASINTYYMNIWNSRIDTKVYEQPITFTATKGEKFNLAIIVNNLNGVTRVIKPMITFADVPNSDYDHFEPYQGEEITISLNGTRYGGTLDVTSGVLTVKSVYADLSTFSWTLMSSANRWQSSDIRSSAKPAVNNQTVADGLLCDYYEPMTNDGLFSSDYAISIDNGGFLRCRNGSAEETPTGHIVYELATPQTIQLTPTQVYLLYGYNTLFGDCGDISLTYDASGIIHIEEAKLDTETLKTIAAASSDFADFKARIAAL